METKKEAEVVCTVPHEERQVVKALAAGRDVSGP